MIKGIRLVAILLFIVALFACGSSEDSTDNNFEYIDQDLQGKIGGTDWTYKSGTAEVSTYDNTLLSIDIYDIEADGGDPCGSFAYFNSDSVVMMLVPDSTGSYNLSPSRVITLYDGYTNYWLTEGTLEILTIDTSGTVTGTIAAGYNSNNYVIGNFTVTYCP